MKASAKQRLSNPFAAAPVLPALKNETSGITADDFEEFLQLQGARITPANATKAFLEVNRFQRVRAVEACVRVLADLANRGAGLYTPAYDAAVVASAAVMAAHISIGVGAGRGDCSSQVEEALLQAERELRTRHGVLVLHDPRPLTLAPRAMSGMLTRSLARAAA